MSTSAAHVMRLASAYQTLQRIYVIAKLGIADLLAENPRSARALSRATHVHEPSLVRLLHGVASLELVREVGPDVFALTKLGRPLCSSAPDSIRDAVIWAGEYMYPTWGGLLATVRSGGPAFRQRFGESTFAYFAAHPRVGALFDGAMRAYIRLAAVHIGNRVRPLPREGTVIDVGGGSGELLAELLVRNSALRGVPLETPQVARRGASHVRPARPFAPCDVVAGDFFDGVPAGGDLYILCRVLHDWSDRDARRILRSVRAVLRSNARLLVVERVLPRRRSGALGLRDVAAMLLGEGRERSRDEWRRLIEGAGLRIARERAVGFGVENHVLDVRRVREQSRRVTGKQAR